MGILCRFCGRRKWWLFCLVSTVLASFLTFIHFETAKLIGDLMNNITHVAEHEDELVHSIYRLSQRMENISAVHLVVNRQIRQLDATMPRERTVKVFGIPEANSTINETETDDVLEEKMREISHRLLHVEMSAKDIEIMHRIGEWQKKVPRAAVAYLANADVKKRLIHASNLTDIGFKVIENRPYGVHVESDKPEDCTLRIDSVSGPHDVANFSLSGVGAWLSDPATDTGEIYVLLKGAQSKEILKFNSTRDLINDQIDTKYQLPFPWTGTGHVVYGGALYFVKQNSATIIRYEFAARRMRKQKDLPRAVVGEECAYESGEYGAVELGLDESGLWASYCQNDTHGNIVLSRLDLYSLEPRRTYHSTLHRNWLYNSFVACGVYYGIRHYEKGNQLVIKYAFNSHTFKNDPISIPFWNESLSQVHYEPKSKRIFIWTDEGHLKYFDLRYKIADGVI